MTNPPDPERDALRAQAMAATAKAVPVADADAERPVFHFHTPAHWMNDPNGPIFYKGWFHMFYQFNPYADGWGNMHWGHARSRDLVDWEHLPVAVWPTKTKGEAHVFSGSSWKGGNGKPVAFYTSIGDKREPEQWAAVSEGDDLVMFSKPSANPILTLAAHRGETIKEWRDPFLFSEGGKTFMLVGGGRNRRGVVLLYEATAPDLLAWNYRGVFFEHPDRNLPNVECPNFVELGRHWVLFTSTHGKVEYFVGTLDVARGTFTPHSQAAPHRGVLMDGAYASQIVADAPRKQCVFFAWFQPPHKAGWAGCLSLPSVLSTSDTDGALLCKPLPGLAALRKNRFPVGSRPLVANEPLDFTQWADGNNVEIVARIKPKKADSVGLRLRVSPDKSRNVEIRYETAKRLLHVSGRAPVPFPLDGDTLTLHVFQDKSIVDVYAGKNGTVALMTAAKSARPEDTGVHVFADGGDAQVASLDVYQLKPARFDKSAFGSI